MQAGGNATTVDGVSLNLADDSGLLAAARAAAIADAKVAAQPVRSRDRPAAGQRYVSLTDQSQPLGVPVNAPIAASPADHSVPISPGSQQLSVSVTVVFGSG